MYRCMAENLKAFAGQARNALPHQFWHMADKQQQGPLLNQRCDVSREILAPGAEEWRGSKRISILYGFIAGKNHALLRGINTEGKTWPNKNTRKKTQNSTKFVTLPRNCNSQTVGLPAQHRKQSQSTASHHTTIRILLLAVGFNSLEQAAPDRPHQFTHQIGDGLTSVASTGNNSDRARKSFTVAKPNPVGPSPH